MAVTGPTSGGAPGEHLPLGHVQDAPLLDGGFLALAKKEAPKPGVEALAFAVPRKVFSGLVAVLPSDQGVAAPTEFSSRVGHGRVTGLTITRQRRPNPTTEGTQCLRTLGVGVPRQVRRVRSCPPLAILRRPEA